MAMGGSSKRALEIELRDLSRHPVEGFSVQLQDDSDIYKWDIRIFGPPETVYRGGYFKAVMKFPHDYPYSPPKLTFLTPMFHPNIYATGEVCISILHAPGHDESSGELASERWNPTQSVRTILLSVISLLTEPNISSPANVDAAILFRSWKQKKDSSFEQRVREQVAGTEADAKRDGVEVPKTLDAYMQQSEQCSKKSDEYVMDFNDDDMFAYDDDDDDDADIGYEEEEDGDDDDMPMYDDGKAQDNDSGMH